MSDEEKVQEWSFPAYPPVVQKGPHPPGTIPTEQLNAKPLFKLLKQMMKVVKTKKVLARKKKPRFY